MSEVARQFIFLGPPGSGKGTQAEALAATLGIPHISTGYIFRDNIARGTALGQQVDALLKAGQLVPDDATNAVIKDRLAQADAAAGFIFDGYPRSLPQAEFLARVAPKARAILIDLPDDEAVVRISGRRTCAACGAVFHTIYKPSRVADTCDVCGGALAQRNDQTESIVRDRLAVYHQQTEPLVQYYTAYGSLVRIDGLPPIPQVTAAIMGNLGL